MAFGAGTAARLVLTSQGGTDYDFDASPYVTNVSPDWPVDEIDVTTIGETSQERQFIAGFKSASMGVEGIFDPTADAKLFPMRGGTPAPGRYYPQGTSTGKPFYQGTFVMTAYSPPTDVDSAVTFTAAFRINRLSRSVV
jgi:predicted secreted protein